MDDIVDFFQNNYDQILQLKNKQKSLDEMLESFGLLIDNKEKPVYEAGYNNCFGFSSMIRAINAEIDKQTNEVPEPAPRQAVAPKGPPQVDPRARSPSNSGVPPKVPPKFAPNPNGPPKMAAGAPPGTVPRAVPKVAPAPISEPSAAHSTSDTSSSVVVLKDLEVRVKVYYEEALDVVKNELLNKRKTLDNQSLIDVYVSRRLQRVVTMLSDGEKEFGLVEPILIRDEFGEWKFDVTFGVLSLSAHLANGSFPKQWKIDKSTRIKVCDPEVIKSSAATGGSNSDDLSLKSFLVNVAERYNKLKKVDTWLEALQGQDVETIDDLMKWQEQDWERFSKISITAKLLIRQHLNELKMQSKRPARANTKGPSPSERMSNIHKMKRFFYYEGVLEDELPYLNQRAVEKTFDEVKQEYEGEQLLNSIRQFFDAYTLQNTKYVKLNRGLLLYGPPGTGKTQITSAVANKIGLTEVVQPLAAAEVNRSLVGQTERILLDLCNRARRVPHLLCCISIDEIDSLTPKRDGGASEHKVDALSVLLAVIGGIKDVPNLIFLASTNRLNMMDEAFLRRMSGKFFVGRPGRKAREAIMKAVEEQKLRIADEQMRFAVTLTTNFSGAAMVQLRSNMIVFSKMNNKQQLTNDELLDLSIIISNQFSIRLGNYSLPLILKTNKQLIDTLNSDSKANVAKVVPSPGQKDNMTGRIHIDLKARVIQTEKEISLEEKAVKGLSSTFKVLPWLADFAFQRSLDYIQLFDLDLLLSSAAFDDNKAMENLTDKVNECGEYVKSMAIFDLDSLVGVNDNESISNMGMSTSYSINNHRMFNFVIQTAKRAIFDENREFWVVVISKHPFLTRTFKKSLEWPLTPEEQKQRRQEEVDKNLPRKCHNCKETYVEADNRMAACVFHDGFIFNAGLSPTQWRPIEQKDIDLLLLKPGFDAKVLTYICCLKKYGDGGCKKAKHNAPVDEDDVDEYVNKLENLRAKLGK